MPNPEGSWYRGRWLFYCDVCGKKMVSTDAKRRWDGLYVCKNDWEMRHPSDFIRARKETSNELPWSRPVLPEGNVAPNYKDVYVAFTDGLSGTDTAYIGTGAYYFYDTSKDVYPSPEAYVIGDYF
jgi:hypothetical protein